MGGARQKGLVKRVKAADGRSEVHARCRERCARSSPRAHGLPPPTRRPVPACTLTDAHGPCTAHRKGSYLRVSCAFHKSELGIRARRTAQQGRRVTTPYRLCTSSVARNGGSRVARAAPLIRRARALATVAGLARDLEVAGGVGAAARAGDHWRRRGCVGAGCRGWRKTQRNVVGGGHNAHCCGAPPSPWSTVATSPPVRSDHW